MLTEVPAYDSSSWGLNIPVGCKKVASNSNSKMDVEGFVLIISFIEAFKSQRDLKGIENLKTLLKTKQLSISVFVAVNLPFHLDVGVGLQTC